MGFKIEVDIQASGAVFDGSWEIIMHTYDIALQDNLANLAVKKIRQFLPTQYMYLGHNGGDASDNPIPPNAGYLVSQIHWDRSTADSVVVNDGGYPAMIYGPWIEGIGPGNLYFGMKGRFNRGLPPRFPGYHAFARTSNELNLVAEDLASTELQPYLAMLNELSLHRSPPGLLLVYGRPGRSQRRYGSGGSSEELLGSRQLGRSPRCLSNGLAVLRRGCPVREPELPSVGAGHRGNAPSG